MKKNLLFLIPMMTIAVLLFVLSLTGMSVHIAASVVGLIILATYTVATRKKWKSPLLEILERVFFTASLITGILLMNVHGVLAISVVHKISAALFTILLFFVEIQKIVKEKSNL